MKKILVIDDEKSIRESIGMILEYEQYETAFSEDGIKGLNLLENEEFDCILLDIKMPGMDGIEVLEKIKSKSPTLPVIMISGHGTIETAIESTRKGAYDFLEKPLDRNKLLITVRNAIEHSKLNSEYIKIKKQVEGKYEILGESESIKSILSLITTVAPTDARVLITGENGSGKELVARQIFMQSNRKNKPFVEVNCAAIPKELIESELFGHEKGSFTGATAQRMGKFEQANGGTIFLDEIGDMSLEAQAKVLRVLELGTFERVGGNQLIKVDVRIISATNKDIQSEIEKGNFREDLYHRLNVIPIIIPSLSERREDIPILVNSFLKEFCEKNKIAYKTLSPQAMVSISKNEWKGNVRELRNFVERLIILVPGNTITEKALEGILNIKQQQEDFDFSKEYSLQDFQEISESNFIKKQLEKNNWNITKTSDKLGIQRSHLYNKMKKYGLVRDSNSDKE
jgi:two-component system, NtrC family, nitrogen regulation response regulator NtrX